MNRRDFLSLRTGEPALLSCERLYMRYLDARSDGTISEFFDHLAGDLRGVNVLRLTDTSWLAGDDLKTQLDAVLDAFRARGGRIDLPPHRSS
jgi:hypothetical protein